MRRARLHVKPILNPRPAARPTSDNKVRSEGGTSKEDESHQKSAEEGTSGSVPAAVETNSSTSRAPKLNFRRPAFSVRPKPSIRGSGVPNLHGTQLAPILVPPAPQGEESVGSGDAEESVVKETQKTEETVSVPVPLDVKEDPAATPEKETLTEAKSADREKNTSKDKETLSLFQRRRARFQVGPKIQSNPPLPPLTTGLQPPEQDVKENVPASEKEIQENKSRPPSDETPKTSKSIPVIKSQFLPCPKLDTKTAKSPAAEFPASQEADTSVLPAAVGTDKATSSMTPKETADKGRLLEPNSEAISKPSTSPQEHSDKAKLLQKPETTTAAAVKTSQPSVRTLSNDETKTLTTSDGVEAVKQKDDTQSDNSSASKEIKPVSIRRSRFSVQPKLGVKTPNRKPPPTSQPQDNGQSLIHTKTAENMVEDDAKETTSKEAAVSSDSSKNESETTVLPRCKRFQIQPKPSIKTAEQPASSSMMTAENLSASQSVTTDDSASICISTEADSGKEKEDSENKVTNKDGGASSKEMASKVETTILPRRSRFQAQPKLRAKTAGQSSASSSKLSAMTLLADQPVTSNDTPSAIISEVNANKQKNNSENKDGNQDIVAESKEMDTKTHFKIQPKSNAKTAGQSSASSTKPTVSNLPESVAPSISTEATSTLKSDGDKQKDESEIKVTNKDADATTDKDESEIKVTNKDADATTDKDESEIKVTNKDADATTDKDESEIKVTNKDADATTDKDESEIKVTNKDADATTDNETTSTVKEVPVPAVSRSMGFQVCPKLGASEPKDEPLSAPVEVKTSDETLKTPNEITSVVETSVLPRRNRFQVQPKASAKTTKQSSSSSPKLNTVKMSLSDNDTTLKCSEDTTTLETDGSKHKEETENKFANKDAEATSKELPLKREQTPLPTLSRRSRFQVHPKVAVSQSKDNQQGASISEKVNEENAKTSNENTGKSEATILPRRNRFQIQPKPNAKTVEQSSSMAASKKTRSNQSVTNNDIPSTCVESVTSDAGSKWTNDSENKDGDPASKDATSKMEKTAAPTLSRRSRFQVRPKLGISKESLKGPGKSNEAKEKRVEKPPPKSTTPAVLNTSKDAKRSKEDRQSTSPQTTTIQDDLLNSESPKASEKSLIGSCVPTTPVKLTGKSSLSSPLKDNIQIENIWQREYPVNVHRSSGKGGKSLPLREKQKKPDVSVHPSDKPPDRGKMRMRDLIYWNPSSNPMKSPDAKSVRPVRLTEDSAPKAPEPTTNENEPVAVPQVKIGADGNIVLNEESLVINNSQPTAPISMEVVDETDVYSNYGSFRKYTPKSKWSLRETKKFFLALSTIGTDFSLMTNLFTKKTRRDLKNKFKREERNNRWLVDKAIQQQLNFDEKLFEELSESEEEEEEPPTKKSRQKKESSESLKKKDTKSSKTKKTSKADSSSPTKKAKKSKKISKKDWVIGSQEEESENIVEEIVEEEPVHDEILIVPENTPFCADTLTRMQPVAENQAKSKPTKVQKAAITPEDQTQEEEVVGILMEMGQRGLGSPPKPRSNVPSSAQGSPRNKAPAPTMPMINTHSAATAVASKAVASGRAKSTPKVPTGVSIPGSSGGAAVSVTPATEEARDSGSLARLFLQQMGLNSQMNALQDEIVSITEAEISHNDQMQKVILVEVQPKDQKQTVVHMYLVSRTDDAQSSADGSGGKVTVSEAQPLALPPSMSSLSDTPPSDVSMASGTESCTAPTISTSTSS